MATYKHADKFGNITTREHGTIYPGAASPQSTVDPFAQYADAFAPIKMEYVPQTPVVEMAPAAPAYDPSLTGIDKYNAHLRRQFIDPNSIGTGYIDRSTGNLVIPSAAQQASAVEELNLGNALEGDYARAASAYWDKGNREYDPAKAIQMRQAARELRGRRGSSYEDKLRYYMGELYGNPNRQSSSNGFSG